MKLLHSDLKFKNMYIWHLQIYDHTYPDSFISANILLRLRLTSRTRIRWRRTPYQKTFENAFESGKFWKHHESGYVWTHRNDLKTIAVDRKFEAQWIVESKRSCRSKLEQFRSLLPALNRISRPKLSGRILKKACGTRMACWKASAQKCGLELKTTAQN